MIATGQELITFVLGILDQFEHAFVLLLVLDRPDRSALLGAVADLHGFRIFGNRGRQFVVDILMDIDAFGGNTDLPGIVKAGPEQLFRDLRYIGIGQHDRGVIAAEFERDALQIL